MISLAQSKTDNKNQIYTKKGYLRLDQTYLVNKKIILWVIALSSFHEQRTLISIVMFNWTGGHLIEFHLIESLDRNFSIKRLKIDQLIE